MTTPTPGERLEAKRKRERRAAFVRKLTFRSAMVMLLVALVGGAGAYFGETHWLLAVAGMVRIQLAGLAVLAGLLFASVKRWGEAGAALAVAVVAAAPLVAHRVVDDVVCELEPDLRVASIRLDSEVPPDSLVRRIRHADADVVFLMGVDAAGLSVRAALSDRYPHALSEPRTDGSGVALLSDRPVDGDAIYIGIGRPSVVARMAVGERTWTVMGSFNEPALTADAVRTVDVHLRGLAARARVAPGPVVVVGDLGVNAHSASLATFLETTTLRDGTRGSTPGAWSGRTPLLRVETVRLLTSEALCVVDRSYGTGAEPFVASVAHR